MNQHKYINVLNKILLPDIPNHFLNGGCIFQHERATCHTAKLVTAFLKNKNISILLWPGNSPDMNPIENLWMIVKWRIVQHEPTSKVTLIEALINVWEHDPEVKEMCLKLIIGMAKSVEQLIKAKSVSTKY